MVGAGGKHPVDGDQVLHPAHLAGEDDVPPGQTQFDRAGGTGDGGLHHCLAHHLLDRRRSRGAHIGVHHASDQVLVQAAPVDADPHRPVVAAGDLDHGRELAVALLAATHVARIDAVLGQGRGTLGVIGQQAVAVEVEVTDQGHGAALVVQPGTDRRDRAGRGLGVDGDAHQFGAGPRQVRHLTCGGGHIRGVGVGHGLDHDRGLAPDGDRTDAHRNRGAPRELRLG